MQKPEATLRNFDHRYRLLRACRQWLRCDHGPEFI
jgi:hypothetical protein